MVARAKSKRAASILEGGSGQYAYEGPEGARTDPFLEEEFTRLAESILAAPSLQGRPDIAYSIYEKEASNMAKDIVRKATGSDTERALAKDAKLGLTGERGDINQAHAQRAITMQKDLNDENVKKALLSGFLNAASTGAAMVASYQKPAGAIDPQAINQETGLPNYAVNPGAAPSAPSSSAIPTAANAAAQPLAKALLAEGGAPASVVETAIVERPAQDGTAGVIAESMIEDYDGLVKRGEEVGLDVRIGGGKSGARTPEVSDAMHRKYKEDYATWESEGRQGNPPFEVREFGKHTEQGGYSAIDIPVGNSKESEVYKFLLEHGPEFGFFPSKGTHLHHWIYAPELKTGEVSIDETTGLPDYAINPEEGDGGEILEAAFLERPTPLGKLREDGGRSDGSRFSPADQNEQDILNFIHNLRGDSKRATLTVNLGEE